MGRDHCLSGILAGLVVTTITGSTGVDAALIVSVTAGAALWPDLDHPSATAARSFWLVSRLAAAGLDRLGVLVYALTATARDKPTSDGHRTITHTVVWAALSGVVVATIAALWPTWGAWTVLFVMISLALRGLLGQMRKRADWFTVSAAAAALTAAAVLADPDGIDPGLLGFCVALGSLVHCLGDSCTIHGCPWLWPVPIKGQTWYRIGTPRWMRFRTGTDETDGEDILRVVMWLLVVPLLAHVVARHFGGWGPTLDGIEAAWAWVAD